jgi:hypothetical protein
MSGFIQPVRDFGGIKYRKAIKTPTALTRKNFCPMAAAVFVRGNMRQRFHGAPGVTVIEQRLSHPLEKKTTWIKGLVEGGHRTLW